MSSAEFPAQVGEALVDFTVRRTFPEDQISAAQVDSSILSAAHVALKDAKDALQVSLSWVSLLLSPNKDSLKFVR